MSSTSALLRQERRKNCMSAGSNGKTSRTNQALASDTVMSKPAPPALSRLVSDPSAIPTPPFEGQSLRPYREEQSGETNVGVARARFAAAQHWRGANRADAKRGSGFPPPRHVYYVRVWLIAQPDGDRRV